MRVIVAGLGIQGKKRLVIAGDDAVATVDPVNPQADYTDIEQIPLNSYDVALVCTPDQAKLELLEYLLSNGKHVLVEKPLLAPSNEPIRKLVDIAQVNEVTCYTAYNHRFEPHIVNLKKWLDAGNLGQAYMCKFFYGNGTARDVRNSPWRDKGTGVLPDLGSHMLDMILYLFGPSDHQFAPWSFNCFENQAFDHVVFGAGGQPVYQLEATLLSWRNNFTLDVFGELGSAHIHCLCKWGPSTFTVRKRVLPSGRPDEESQVLTMVDPTWAAEYEYFKQLCQTGTSNLENDIWINTHLHTITHQGVEEASL